jgi:threonine dehydrogenase-like Zn-dependent dehydrogenase
VPGDCIVVSPDLGVVAFGYVIDGGLQQYNVVSGELLDFLIKVPAEAVRERGMFALSLSEPLACVERGLDLVYRDAPDPEGRMLVWADANARRFSFGGLTDLPAQVVLFEEDGTCRVVRDALEARGIHVRVVEGPEKLEGPFDDILIVSDDEQVIESVVAWGEHRLREFGIIALLGDPKAGEVPVDIGLAHYSRTLIVGSHRADVRDAYARNTAFGLRNVGETARRPGKVIAAEIRPDRLEKLRRMAAWLNAQETIRVIDTSRGLPHPDPLPGGEGERLGPVDHAVLLCDDTRAFQEAVGLLADGGIVNAFAGLKGETVTVSLRDLCVRGIRVIGHSGVTFDIHERALRKVLAGDVDLAPVVSAVGGIDAAWDGLRAADARTLPGKTVLYQDIDMPLTPLDRLTGGRPWSADAERKLLREHGITIKGLM